MAGDPAKRSGNKKAPACGGNDGSKADRSKEPATGSKRPGASHYPLNGGPLPFARYDHRRITARDIMVHRIMTDLMNPKRVEARTYDQRITYPAEFEPIKAQDHELGLDLQVLRKMLFTSHANDPSKSAFLRQPGKHAAAQKKDSRGKRPPLEKRLKESQAGHAVTIEDQILDLVTRHYLETDDSTLRVWMARAKPPRVPSGPRAPLPNNRGRNILKGQVRAEAVKEHTKLIDNQRKRDRKQWLEEDSAHLRSLKEPVAVQNRLHLYDGGLFAHLLQHRIDYDMARPKGARHNLETNHWAITTKQSTWLSLPKWPEKSTTQRLILQPSRADLKQTQHPLKTKEAFTLLDFNLDPGRGRNHDSYWTTGQGYAKLRGHHKVLTRADGRYSRARRRCCSEPPPDSFMVANFPIPDQAVGSVQLEIVVPRMKLSTLDRRSRRRSLSRTRIEEMFDWDFTLPRGPRYNAYPGKPGVTGEDGVPNDPKADTSKRWSHRRCKCKPKPGATAEATTKATAKAKSTGSEKPAKKVTKWPCKCHHFKPCENCGRTSHLTQDCRSPCGHCGAPNPIAKSTIPSADLPMLDSNPYSDAPEPGMHQFPHTATQCPVARQNRCKCVPFPTFHTAMRCPVACSRACGHPEPAGTFRHKNAMTCKLRCCMCGLHGHSGRECRLQTCRCGGAHLGQDCCWKPECRVPGCDRFWCGLHCRQCGSNQKPFVGWRCRACLGFDPGDSESNLGPESVPLPDDDDVGAHGREEEEDGDTISSVRKEKPDVAKQNRKEGLSSEGQPPRHSIFGSHSKTGSKNGTASIPSQHCADREGRHQNFVA